MNIDMTKKCFFTLHHGVKLTKIIVFFFVQPVDMFEPNNLGFNDVIGNVWQWLEDHFNGLPGFKTSYLYDDFSSPCFDGRHNLIVVPYILLVLVTIFNSLIFLLSEECNRFLSSFLCTNCLHLLRIKLR